MLPAFDYTLKAVAPVQSARRARRCVTPPSAKASSPACASWRRAARSAGRKIADDATRNDVASTAVRLVGSGGGVVDAAHRRMKPQLRDTAQLPWLVDSRRRRAQIAARDRTKCSVPSPQITPKQDLMTRSGTTAKATVENLASSRVRRRHARFRSTSAHENGAVTRLTSPATARGCMIEIARSIMIATTYKQTIMGQSSLAANKLPRWRHRRCWDRPKWVLPSARASPLTPRPPLRKGRGSKYAMPQLLIEFFSEEIPARMQKRAEEDLGAGARGEAQGRGA